MGYDVSARGLDGDLRSALEQVRRPDGMARVACLNPHSLVVARGDPEFRAALERAELLLPDGAGIVLAARVLGLPLPGRVAGFEFFQGLTRLLEEGGGARYFFLGSTQTVLDALVARLAREHPHITVCGTYSPPFAECFTEEQNAAMIEAVCAARPDVLWVGMTAPKQEKWIEAQRARLDVPLTGAIGAVFDFYAGTRKRSSPLMRRLGLEWLPRLIREPRRMFVRNFVSTPVFLGLLATEWLRRRCGAKGG